MDPILRLAARAEDRERSRRLPGEAELAERFLTHPALAYQELLERFTPIVLRMVRRFFRDQDDVMEVYTAVCERLRAGDYLALRRFRPGSEVMPWLSVVVANACRDRLRRTQVVTIPRALAARLDAREQLIYRYHFGHRVAPEDIAEMLGAQHGQPASPLDVLATVEKINRLLGTARRWELLNSIAARRTPESLDTLIDDGLDRAGDPADALDEALAAQDTVDVLGAALAALDPEDRLLVQLRFEQDLTAVEIANVLHYDHFKHVYTRLRTVLGRLRRTLSAQGL